MTLSERERDRMTVGQERKLAKTRDCPLCSDGSLSRMDVVYDDEYVGERYKHVGNGDCPGHRPDNGLFGPTGTVVEHWIDGVTRCAAGALEGEF